MQLIIIFVIIVIVECKQFGGDDKRGSRHADHAAKAFEHCDGSRLIIKMPYKEKNSLVVMLALYLDPRLTVNRGMFGSDLKRSWSPKLFLGLEVVGLEFRVTKFLT